MRPRLHEPLLILVPCSVLFLVTRINYYVWPLVWPDEALFSSPAASLVESGIFATPVLKGLIPGMEQATLWNSPLYMLLVAAAYTITGESLHVARLVSFALGCGTLLIFFRLSRMFLSHRFLALLITTLLALDPTFQRAANTARMDMLTLFFFVAALFFLSRARYLREQGQAADLNRRSRQRLLYAGFCVGMAAISHPAAVLLIPVSVIFALPGKRNLVWIVAGMALPLLCWLAYIIPNFEIFEVQFASQLLRKKEMVSLWDSGDSGTGGVLKVFASQFGGTKILMIGALLSVGLSGLLGFSRFVRRTPGAGGQLYKRIFLSYSVVLVMVLFMSEAWYPIYVTPLMLLTAAIPAGESGTGQARRIPIAFIGLFFFVATITLIGREHFIKQTPRAVREFQAHAVDRARNCRSIYLRVRPDPYFALRTAYPDMEILEFIPGKLSFEAEGGRTAYLTKRYATIQCFLLDQNSNWEPILSAYLDRDFRRFSRTEISGGNALESATLWRRY